ncbi:MAG: acyltransferase family protein [Candidatus Hermodarchaeota archaeon]
MKTFYKKRFIKIFPPYLFFCFLYIVIPPLIDGRSIVFSFEVFLNIFFDPWNFFYHFWYIALIISFYLFYPLLVRIFVKFKDRLFLILIISIFIQIIYRIYLIPIVFSLRSLSELLILYKVLNWLLEYLFLRYIAFFVLGVYISHNYEKLILNGKYLYLSIIPVIIFNILSEFVYREYLEPFFSFSIIVLFLFLLKNKRSKFLEGISKYSYGMYLLHGIVLTYMGRTLNIYFNSWFFYLYAFILTLSISYIIIYGLSKIPKSHYFLGYVRRE